jgi:hypothetical protein
MPELPSKLVRGQQIGRRETGSDVDEGGPVHRLRDGGHDVQDVYGVLRPGPVRQAGPDRLGNSSTPTPRRAVVAGSATVAHSCSPGRHRRDGPSYTASR